LNTASESAIGDGFVYADDEIIEFHEIDLHPLQVGFSEFQSDMPSARKGRSIDEIEETYHTRLEASQIRPRSGDFFQSISGTVAQQGGSAWLRFELFPNELMHIQLEMLGNSDFDMFLYRETNTGLQPVGSSALRTIFNANHAPLPEMIGIINDNAFRSYIIFVDSIVGHGPGHPFTLNIGVNTVFDGFEVDGISNPVSGIRVGDIGTLSVRSLNTRADNDWFVVPVSQAQVSTYRVMEFRLDNASAARGYTVSAYMIQNNQARRLNMGANGSVELEAGNMLVRVAANGQPITGANYTLTINTPLRHHRPINTTPINNVPVLPSNPNPRFVYLPDFRFESGGIVEFDVELLTRLSGSSVVVIQYDVRYDGFTWQSNFVDAVWLLNSQSQQRVTINMPRSALGFGNLPDGVMRVRIGSTCPFDVARINGQIVSRSRWRA